MTWLLEKSKYISSLNYVTCIHHDHLISNLGDDTQVVSYPNDRHVKTFAQILD